MSGFYLFMSGFMVAINCVLWDRTDSPMFGGTALCWCLIAAFNWKRR